VIFIGVLSGVAQRVDDFPRYAVNANALSEPHQRAAQRCVLLDVDLLAIGQTAFELLGQDGGGGEPADELLARLAALISAGLIGQDGTGNILEPSSDDASAINIW
jgi:hypothetical protein